jgi:hypothetical protein
MGGGHHALIGDQRAAADEEQRRTLLFQHRHLPGIIAGLGGGPAHDPGLDVLRGNECGNQQRSAHQERE